jgi:hypothetical protein
MLSGNFFYALVTALEMTLDQVKKNIAKYIETYGSQSGYDSEESFYNYYVVESAVRTGYQSLFSDD